MSGQDRDPTYVYTPEEERRLVQNISSILIAIDSGKYRIEKYRLNLICEWHRQLFLGVRSHAGRYRTSGFGPERLTFGPNRSVHRDEVHSKLEEHCKTANKLITKIKEQTKELDIHFVAEAIKVAAYVHADFIKIHPFIDGNGRVGRVIMDWVLLEIGFPKTVAFHIPADEYRGILNHYYRTDDIVPLVDLVLRSYAIYID